MRTNCSNYFPWKMRLLIIFVCGNTVFSSFIPVNYVINCGFLDLANDCHTFLWTVTDILVFNKQIFSPKILQLCLLSTYGMWCYVWKESFHWPVLRQTATWNISTDLQENSVKHHVFHVMNFEVFMMYCAQLWYGVNIRPTARILELLRKVYLYFSVAFQDTVSTDALQKYPSFLKCWIISLLCRMQQMKIPLYNYN
jgi:hypothetical protein